MSIWADKQIKSNQQDIKLYNILVYTIFCMHLVKSCFEITNVGTNIHFHFVYLNLFQFHISCYF